MQVSVESPSKIERRITVVVPYEKLSAAFDKKLDNIAKKAKIDGFRPGKAPLNVIKQRYGDAARQEALSEVIQSSLYEAMTQEKLNPVGVPSVEPKVIADNQPLEYVATIEVLPEIGTVKLDLPSLDKQVATITDGDVDRVIDHLREQHTTWKIVERAAQDKDQVVIDFRGSIDGVVFPGGEAHDYPIVIGSKRMIPGFEDGVIGMKAGDEKTIQVTFPAEYFAKELSGKTADFAIKAIKISEPNLPEFNEAFIKKLGVKSGSPDELRAEVRKNLERELDRVIKAKLKNAVFDKLLEQNPVEVPKALIDREAGRIHDEVHPHHGQEHHHSEAEMAMFNDAAKRNVALGLLMSELLKQHDIKADKAKVQAHLTTMASSYEDPKEVLEWYAKNKQAYAQLEMGVLEEQLVEKLLENVKVTEKVLSYQDMMANQ